MTARHTERGPSATLEPRQESTATKQDDERRITLAHDRRRILASALRPWPRFGAPEWLALPTAASVLG
ncbi:MAG: hypothetical protein ACT4QF_00240 [Sporichthyaceae bacterium]